ncbi:hypothetical protein CO583_01745 [Parasaccharibacter sp. TMW2.1882]|uniref:S24 family peptidase n=1 Tax=Parasaccharibacter sp. TMW2.1882 TaxID=2039286 RepID=UPI0020110270|nr:S24 family peptidase [Parasaccharibacter sp. TMW2.1882]MCL1496233.1 hypothetical protein [Parasaccharibacter sp. TMW2.1882]
MEAFCLNGKINQEILSVWVKIFFPLWRKSVMTKTRNTQQPHPNHLRSYLVALGMTYEEAGSAVGLPPTGIWRPANGERKLQLEVAIRLWKAFGFPAEDVGHLYVKEPCPEYFALHNVEWKGPLPKGASVKRIPGVKIRLIPVIGAVQAGVFSEALEVPDDERYSVSYPTDDGYPASLNRYALEVKGQSMNRVFPEGSVVCVIDYSELGRPPETGDFAVVRRRDPYGPGVEATIKALQILDDGSACLWPQSTDPNFQQPIILKAPDLETPDNAGIPEIQIKSLVVGMIKTRLRATF